MKTQTKDNIFIGIIWLIIFAFVFLFYLTLFSQQRETELFKEKIKKNSSIWYNSNVEPIETDTLLNCDYDHFISEDDTVKCTIHTESKEPIHLVCNKDFCFKD